MIDFRKLLTPEARDRLDKHKGQVARFGAMSDQELQERAQYFLDNCATPKWRPGDPVYDAVVWHVILPELIRRLK